MVIVHGTQRFRQHVPGAAAVHNDISTALLGAWYATLLRWRPAVALFVNESTLLPLFIPVAPAGTLLNRLPVAIAELLTAHHAHQDLIDTETAETTTIRMAPTVNRSVVGIMNEFAHLADAARDLHAGNLLGISVRLAATPCSPLYPRRISPDRELAALIAQHTPQ